jgi:hypothetical protein
MKELPWNRCDICGQYIAIIYFRDNLAYRGLVTPDSEFTCEEYETFCPRHNPHLNTEHANDR